MELKCYMMITLSKSRLFKDFIYIHTCIYMPTNTYAHTHKYMYAYTVCMYIEGITSKPELVENWGKSSVK